MSDSLEWSITKTGNFLQVILGKTTFEVFGKSWLDLEQRRLSEFVELLNVVMIAPFGDCNKDA